MPRPRNKEDLILAANTNYEKLMTMIESRTEDEKSICYDFSGDEKKKEAHWKRDKNLRDVLMHLHEWHLLLLEWIKNRENGSAGNVFAGGVIYQYLLSMGGRKLHRKLFYQCDQQSL